MALNFDLNFPLTALAEGDLASSSSNIDRGAALEAPNSEIFGSTVIDLEATDDDVELLSSTPAWLKGRDQSRRNQLHQVVGVPPIQSGYTVEDPVTTLSLNSLNYHERVLMRSEVIDCELYSSSESNAAKESQLVATPHPAPPPLPPKEPTFNCPVCWDELTCPCSTVCGHIFCRHCVAEYIKREKKCPTCRKKLTLRNFHRVFLPATEAE